VAMSLPDTAPVSLTTTRSRTSTNLDNLKSQEMIDKILGHKARET
jgi:hypothetical protein